MWILPRPSLDLTLILGFAPLIACPLFIFLPDSYLTLFLLPILVLDTCHTYSTLLRTYFKKGELIQQKYYWYLPLAIVMGLGCLYYFRVPNFVNGIFALNFFHNIRQSYGICRWYQKINKRICGLSNYFLYVLTSFPFVLVFFRPAMKGQSYFGLELLILDNPPLFQAGLGLYFAHILAWLVFEVRLWWGGTREWNRFLSILSPALCFGSAFLLADSFMRGWFINVATHSTPYLAIMAQSLFRIYREKGHGFGEVLTALFLFCLASCLFQIFVLSGKGPESYPLQDLRFLEALAIGTYFLPNFIHIITDAFIWKSSHHEYRVVFRT